MVEQQTEIQKFSGPLPAPFILQSYDQIVPGAAERIIQMAEQDAEHQRSIEAGVLRAAERDSTRGQVFGLIVALAALTAAVVALLLGYEYAASIIGGTTVVGLASVFVIGRIWRDRE